MKRLYILLLLLILIYINVNIAYSILDPSEGFTNLFANKEEIEDNNTITLGSSSFEKLGNFTSTEIGNNTISLVDSLQNLTINVSEIDDTSNLSETVDNLLINDASITSNQTLDQNGVTVYYLYSEGPEAYNSNIYFNKNGHNYLIRGENIGYDESDYFITNCKEIIDSMNKKEEQGKSGFSIW